MIHLVSDIRFSTDLEFFPLFKLTSLRGLLTALLAGQFSQLVEVYLSQLSTLSGTTLSTVFSALQNTGDHRLRTLHISGVNLSSLDPDLLQGRGEAGHLLPGGHSSDFSTSLCHLQIPPGDASPGLTAESLEDESNQRPVHTQPGDDPVCRQAGSSEDDLLCDLHPQYRHRAVQSEPRDSRAEAS